MQTDANQFLSRLIQLSQLRLERERHYSFPDHKGRPGEVGGSMPRGGTTPKPDESYRATHRPMQDESGASRLHDLTGAFGEDIYGPNALQYFGSGDKREREVLRVLKSVRGNPEADVTVYRAVPKGITAINPGDWVSISKSVADDYAQAFGEFESAQYHVLSQKVKAKDITAWADSLLEFGYFPNHGKFAYATAAKGYGYRMALMGFDFTDLEEKRRKFQWYLESHRVDSYTAHTEAMRLDHSWEFAAYKENLGPALHADDVISGKDFLNSLDPWLGALDMTPGSVGLKLYEKYKAVREYGPQPTGATCYCGQPNGLMTCSFPSCGGRAKTQRNHSAAESRTDFQQIKDIYNKDAVRLSIALRTYITQARDALTQLVERQAQQGPLSAEFAQSVRVNTGHEFQTAVEAYLMDVWRRNRDAAIAELPEKLRAKLQGMKRYSFPDHEGRPGQVGGSLPRDSSGGDAQQAHEDTNKALASHAAGRQKQIDEVAKYIGVPEGVSVIYAAKREQSANISVAGKEFTVGGDFNASTNTVRIFEAAFSDVGFESDIVAHELQHARMNEAYKKAAKEQMEVMQLDESTGLVDKLGNLNGEGQRIFPYAAIVNGLNSLSFGEQLRKEDGVTPYSDSYWHKPNGDYHVGSPLYWRAVDETLAEIARLDYRTEGKAHYLAHPTWGSLYKWIKTGKPTHVITYAREIATRQYAADGEPELIYINDKFEIVDNPADATVVKIVYPDGRVVFGVPAKPKAYAVAFRPDIAGNYFHNRALLIKGIVDDELTRDAKFSIFETLKGGRTMNEAMGDLRSIFEPWIGDPTKIEPSGISQTEADVLKPYRLENIIRTESTTAIAQGRAAVADAAADFVVGFEHSSILDDRTTEVCQLADGITFKKDDPRAVKLQPPLHFNCRSIDTFVTADDDVEWTSEEDLDAVVRLIMPEFK